MSIPASAEGWQDMSHKPLRSTSTCYRTIIPNHRMYWVFLLVLSCHGWFHLELWHGIFLFETNRDNQTEMKREWVMQESSQKFIESPITIYFLSWFKPSIHFIWLHSGLHTYTQEWLQFVLTQRIEVHRYSLIKTKSYFSLFYFISFIFNSSLNTNQQGTFTQVQKYYSAICTDVKNLEGLKNIIGMLAF